MYYIATEFAKTPSSLNLKEEGVTLVVIAVVRLALARLSFGKGKRSCSSIGA